MRGNLKKTIAIVVLAAFTLAAFNMLSAPYVKAQSLEIKILSYSWHVAPPNTVLAVREAGYVGDLVAVGEVQNNGSTVVDRVVVSGLAYNSTGVVDSATANVFGNNLLPGQKAPFYMDFSPLNSETLDQSWVPSVTNVTMVSALATYSNATKMPYSGLSIPSESITASVTANIYTLRGYVENNGAIAAGNVFVITTFYNASGTAVSMNFTNYLTNSLAPGGAVPFTATPADNSAQLSSEITSYSTLIQSTTTSSSAPPSATLTATPSSSSSSSPTSSSQPTKSAGLPQSLMYGVVIAAVVIVGVLVSLILLRRHRKNVQFETLWPPPPPPPPPPSS